MSPSKTIDGYTIYTMKPHSKPPGMYRTEGSPAPGELVRLQGFLNTWSAELDIEDFNSPEAMEKWLRASSLWNEKKHITARTYQQIMSFRQLLRQSLMQPDQWLELEKLQAGLSFRIGFNDSGAPNLLPQGHGSDLVLGQLMTIIYNSMVDGSWSRFKCCGLESCGWAFYDSTRSRTRRWCSMRTCGSRYKARQYYQRNH